MKIGNTYEVVIAELLDGTFEKGEMKLRKIVKYKGIEIYIFTDENGYDMATYKHNNKIDWNFMTEIQEKFGY